MRVIMDVLNALTSEWFKYSIVTFYEWAFQQVDAIRYRRKHSFQELSYCFGPARQVHNQCLVSNSGGLTRKNSGRHILQTRCPHQFSEPRHHARTHSLCGLRRYVSHGGTRTTARGDEACSAIVCHMH